MNQDDPTILICAITPVLVQIVILSLLPHKGYVKSEGILLVYYGNTRTR